MLIPTALSVIVYELLFLIKELCLKDRSYLSVTYSFVHFVNS